MPARALLLGPFAAVLAALAGVAFAQTPLLAAAVGLTLGTGVALAQRAAAERRLVRLTERVARYAAGDLHAPLDLGHSSGARRLAAALQQLGASLRARAEQLGAQRSQVQHLLDDLTPAILLFDGERLAYANRAARAMFSAGSAVERTPLQVLGIEGLAGAVREARETGRAVEVEVRRGARILAARASRGAGDEVALVVTDATEARRLEDVRRDFVVNASHELKTPAASISALSESLAVAMRRDLDRAHGMVERLQRESARLARLVSDLLDLARLEEEGAAGRREAVDLAALAVAEAERVGVDARERAIDVCVDAPAPATVIGIPQDLRLLLGNLLDNAVRYNRDGGRVEVRVARDDGRIVVEVADTGIGIAAADSDRIFERFYRVDRARSRAVGGTGIGLSIARHAAQRHGGDISVRSVLGEGSTFRVVLPVEGSRQDRG